MDAGVDVREERRDKALLTPDGEGEFFREEFLGLRIGAEIGRNYGIIAVIVGR